MNKKLIAGAAIVALGITSAAWPIPAPSSPPGHKLTEQEKSDCQKWGKKSDLCEAFGNAYGVDHPLTDEEVGIVPPSAIETAAMSILVDAILILSIVLPSPIFWGFLIIAVFLWSRHLDRKAADRRWARMAEIEHRKLWGNEK